MRRFLWMSQLMALECHRFHDGGPHVHVSIRSPGQMPETPTCGSMTLHLAFGDISDKTPGADYDHLFREDQALELVEFIERFAENRDVIVNCEAGVSRSPGVVLSLRRHFGGDTEEVFKKACPNIYVTSILSKVLRERRQEHNGSTRPASGDRSETSR